MVHEEARFVEIARNSVLVPFGLRRSESYYFCPTMGEFFIEEKYHPPGEGNPSVGPFPRNLSVSLMTLEPRLALPMVNLLQYAVLAPPEEGALASVKRAAFDTVEAVASAYHKVVNIVGSPYPVFVVFAPRKTFFHHNRLIMKDATGHLLPLAYGNFLHGCLATERLCVQHRLHAICGLLVREGRYLALSPLSLLVENRTGLKLIRIT